MKWTRDEKRARAAKLRAQGTSDNPRDRAGCIATLRDEDSGRIVTLHRNGFRRDALLAVAEWCDATPGDWRLIGYSTPETIRGDLDGRRILEQPPGRDGLETRYVTFPEVEALERLGRPDLIAREHVKHSYKEHRGRLA